MKKEQIQILICFIIIILCIIVYIAFLCCPPIDQIKEYFKSKKETFNCIVDITRTLSSNNDCKDIFKEKEYNSNQELVNIFLKSFLNTTLNNELIDNQEKNISDEIISFIKSYKAEINSRDDFKKAVREHLNDYVLKHLHK